MAEVAKDSFWENRCQHYKRACKLLAPCCNKFYRCHICHDENENHMINRYEIKQHMCYKCSKIQGVNRNCLYCGIKFSEFSCLLCYIFDELKGQFHCYECGLCRIGGKDNYFHCYTCNICLALRFMNNHNCVPQRSCSLCAKNLNTTSSNFSILSCGHAIHKKCDQELKKINNHKKCLLCNV